MFDKILIATNNPGKLREYQTGLSGLNVRLVSLEEAGITEKADEDGDTFEQNAVKKAKFFSEISNLPVLADDSGLEIDYLNGEPGVKSRRWPGYEATDRELINLTIEKLRGVPKEKRGAQMRVVLAFTVPKGKIITFEGKIRGVILEEPKDTFMPGFPFRALFYIEGSDSMLGEKESHRKQAIEKAIPVLKQILTN